MNPLRVAEQLRTDYLQLPTTTFAPRQEQLKQDFRAAVEREGFLAWEPHVSLALPYQGAPALTELLAETRERFGAIAETPYAHQGEAVRRILAGLPTVTFAAGIAGNRVFCLAARDVNEPNDTG
jgi:hypothetical protein